MNKIKLEVTWDNIDNIILIVERIGLCATFDYDRIIINVNTKAVAAPIGSVLVIDDGSVNAYFDGCLVSQELIIGEYYKNTETGELYKCTGSHSMGVSIVDIIRGKTVTKHYVVDPNIDIVTRVV